MSIYEVCLEVHNFFCTDSDIHAGTYTIAGGELTSCDFLLENQYFRIKGSHFNDGVYKYNAESLTALVPETFVGSIWAMSPPRDFIDLCGEMSEWEAKYGGADSVAMSPYTSENFGGEYSYSKPAGGSADGGAGYSAINAYANDLKKYRRLNHV